jgi:hypothetical protein
MATWKKVVLSGKDASLSSLTLTTALAATQGGTGHGTYAQGDILYANTTTSLARLAIGATNKVLKVNSGVPSWQDDSAGTVSTVSSGNSDLLDASTVGSAVTLTVQTNATLNGSDNLATGAQIKAYADANYNDNLGTVTSVAATGTVSGISISQTGVSTGAAQVTLSGTVSDLTSAAFAAGQAQITVGSSAIALGSAVTALAGMTGIGFASQNVSIANGMGAATLTLAGSASTVRIPGNLTVNGTTDFAGTSQLNIADKVIVLASGSAQATNGGFVIEQASNGSGQYFGFDATADRFGLKSAVNPTDSAGPSLTLFIPTVQIAASAPSADPTFGGTSGEGNIAIDTTNEEVYIYA